MKRSPALISLSRDHHHALEVALWLRRAGPRDLDDTLDRLRQFWEPRGRRHFEIEEQVLLGAVDAADAEWAAAARRVRAEHDAIRARVDGIDTVDAAHELGRLLHDHVRFEERTLFGLLEERLSDAHLMQLGKALEQS